MTSKTFCPIVEGFYKISFVPPSEAWSAHSPRMAMLEQTKYMQGMQYVNLFFFFQLHNQRRGEVLLTSKMISDNLHHQAYRMWAFKCLSVQGTILLKFNTDCLLTDMFQEGLQVKVSLELFSHRKRILCGDVTRWTRRQRP